MSLKAKFSSYTIYLHNNYTLILQHSSNKSLNVHAYTCIMATMPSLQVLSGVFLTQSPLQHDFLKGYVHDEIPN